MRTATEILVVRCIKAGAVQTQRFRKENLSAEYAGLVLAKVKADIINFRGCKKPQQKAHI